MEKVEKEKICNKPKNLAFLAALFGGILVHLFGLLNILHNHDNIAVQYIGYGRGLPLGRWLLSVLAMIFQKLGFGYNLAWLNGFLFILLISIASYLLVDLFSIKNKWNAILIGLIMVAFPTVTATLLYRYTVVYYGISIVLAIFTAHILIKSKHKVWAFIIGTITTACSLGIYQAYFPLLAATFVLYLIQQVLKNIKDWKQILLSGIYFVSTMIVGLVIYFIASNILVKLFHEVLSSYQGVNSIGKLGINEMFDLVITSFKNFFYTPLNNFGSLSSMALIKYSYILLGVISFINMIVIIFKKKINYKNILLLLLLCVFYPIAVNLIVVMVPEGFIYTLMVYSYTIVLITPIVILETMINVDEENNDKKEIKKKSEVIFENVVSKTVLGLVSIAVFCYAYQANVNYTATYYANRQTENYFSSLVTQVRMSEGYRTDCRWAFIGNLNDPLFKNTWQNTVTYGGVLPSNVLTTTYSWQDWFQAYIGYSIPFASDAEIQILKDDKVVKEMPCWPNQGSIKVINDQVIIKFSN